MSASLFGLGEYYDINVYTPKRGKSDLSSKTFSDLKIGDTVFYYDKFKKFVECKVIKLPYKGYKNYFRIGISGLGYKHKTINFGDKNRCISNPFIKCEDCNWVKEIHGIFALSKDIIKEIYNNDIDEQCFNIKQEITIKQEIINELLNSKIN